MFQQEYEDCYAGRWSDDEQGKDLDLEGLEIGWPKNDESEVEYQKLPRRSAGEGVQEDLTELVPKFSEKLEGGAAFCPSGSPRPWRPAAYRAAPRAW